jgi:anti-sigma B factor antagonist
MALTFIDWERDGVLVLNLIGRLALGQGTQLLRQLIDDALLLGKKDIILNLAEVVYVDSSGLGELAASHMRVSKQHGRLKLVRLTPRAQEIMQLTRLHMVMEIFDDEDSALSTFKR